MSIKKAFEKKALIPYFTFGYPSIDQMPELIQKSIQSGAKMIEIGLPFSDPIADGPVIQNSHLETLQKYPKISFDDLFEVIEKTNPSVPIIIMTSINLIMAYGIKLFFKNASKYIEGVVIPDLPVESASEIEKEAKKNKISLNFLISPLCSEKRMTQLVKKSTGFVYLISTLGTTGERTSLDKNLKKIVQKIKAIKNIPVAIGFGISSKEQVDLAYQMADGAIIGSHFIKLIAKTKDQKGWIDQLGQRLQALQ